MSGDIIDLDVDEKIDLNPKNDVSYRGSSPISMERHVKIELNSPEKTNKRLEDTPLEVAEETESTE